MGILVSYSLEEILCHPLCQRGPQDRVCKLIESSLLIVMLGALPHARVLSEMLMPIMIPFISGVLRNDVGVFLCLFSSLIPSMKINFAKVQYFEQSKSDYHPKKSNQGNSSLNPTRQTRLFGVMLVMEVCGT